MKKETHFKFWSIFLKFFIFLNLIFIFMLIEINPFKSDFLFDKNVILNIDFILEIVTLLLVCVFDNYKITKQKNINFDLKKDNERLECCYDNIRSFKHDFFNIMQSIGGYIAVRDIDGLKNMYASIVEECQDISNEKAINKNQINNPAIYHLINQKYALSKKMGIKMSVMVLSDLNNLNASDFEICRILGILLDNAIEATEECDEKFISVKFVFDRINCRDLIIVENPCKNYLINIDKLFEKGFTTKKNKINHGLGLWKINQIVKMNKNINIVTERGESFKQEVSIKAAS